VGEVKADRCKRRQGKRTRADRNEAIGGKVRVVFARTVDRGIVSFEQENREVECISKKSCKKNSRTIWIAY
jgi:hypothetical protein